MSIFDTALHIPAEQRPFVPPRALTRITLPLTGRFGPRFAVATFGAVLMALACVALAVVLARAEGDPSKYGLAAIFLAAALIPAAVAFTAVRDVLSARTVVVIDPQGLRDTRLGGSRIAWDDVEAAEIVGSGNGITAVRLTLKQEGAPRYDPFRIGGWSVEWKRRRRDRVVALSLLDRRPHDLAHTIVTLAGRHGAAIEQDATIWE